MENLLEQNDWQTLVLFFPNNWQEKAKELGAIDRKRNFKNPSDLLRVLLMHLSDNCSLLETSIRANTAGIASISDVALLKRLKCSSEWFRWMSNKLIQKLGVKNNTPDDFKEYNVKSIDATVITEPGSRGTDWRLHYSFGIFNMSCTDFLITGPKTGETLRNFNVNKNDLLIGDKAYCKYPGLKYVAEKGGYFIVRHLTKAFSLYNQKNERLNLLEILRQLKIDEKININAYAQTRDNEKFPIRICAIRKSQIEAEKSYNKAIKEKKKRMKTINPETMELYNYVIVVTNLPEHISADRILDMYRLRWQIELAFKRLKSIFGLGHLPKKDLQAAKAWLHGKLFVALLAESIVDEGQRFSPWGYPIHSGISREVSLA